MAGSIFVPDFELTCRWPAAADGRYPGGEATYKCAIERDRYADAVGADRLRVRAEILEKHVTSVSIDDPDSPDGKTTLKPSAADWKKIHPEIAGFVLLRVLDYERGQEKKAST